MGEKQGEELNEMDSLKLGCPLCIRSLIARLQYNHDDHQQSSHPNLLHSFLLSFPFIVHALT
jgi:hypothetical protein